MQLCSQVSPTTLSKQLTDHGTLVDMTSNCKFEHIQLFNQYFDMDICISKINGVKSPKQLSYQYILFIFLLSILIFSIVSKILDKFHLMYSEALIFKETYL